MEENQNQLTWTGPFAWPRYEAANGLPSVPNHPGVYLFTVQSAHGNLIYAAGVTGRPIPVRLREHTLKYKRGDYTVLDIDAMQSGRREEIWHGSWLGWDWTPARLAEFESQKPRILDALNKQLAEFRIFVAHITDQRIRERLEAAIMNTLYQAAPPFCDIPDKGMRLAPRRVNEVPIIMKQSCSAVHCGLPKYLEV